MPTQPLISIIVPVYNTAETLARCLKSLQAQSYRNLEIILVDDGSPDRAGELCDEFAAKDSRIKVIHQRNAGLSAARNSGLKLASGEFITFVDSDDTVSRHMIKNLVEPALNYDLRLAICSFKEIFPDDKAKDYVSQPLQQVELMSVQTCLKAMLCDERFTMSAWGKLYHRSLFNGIKFPKGKLHEDVGTTYRLVMRCQDHQIAFLPLTDYCYYQTPNSIIHQGFTFAKLDLIELTDQMCDELDRRFPELLSVTKLRRAHARFSILRQMVVATPTSAERAQFLATRQEIVHYLRTHWRDVLVNPSANLRDRAAMATLLLGLPVFILAWKIYR